MKVCLCAVVYHRLGVWNHMILKKLCMQPTVEIEQEKEGTFRYLLELVVLVRSDQHVDELRHNLVL